MMVVFDPVGTPWHSVILLFALAEKRWTLATRFYHETNEVEYPLCLMEFTLFSFITVATRAF